jgi:hypothetical protein
MRRASVEFPWRTDYTIAKLDSDPQWDRREPHVGDLRRKQVENVAVFCEYFLVFQEKAFAVFVGTEKHELLLQAAGSYRIRFPVMSLQLPTT